MPPARVTRLPLAETESSPSSFSLPASDLQMILNVVIRLLFFFAFFFPSFGPLEKKINGVVFTDLRCGGAAGEQKEEDEEEEAP